MLQYYVVIEPSEIDKLMLYNVCQYTYNKNKEDVVMHNKLIITLSIKMEGEFIWQKKER